jgi:prepilin-type N-terminal cleavage/methylation domain-containing protein
MKSYTITTSSNRRRLAGFTLLESLMAIVIVGTGTLSILAAQQAFHRQNDWAQRSSSAMLLANELRELTLSMPRHDPITGIDTVGPEAGESSVSDFDDVDDFAGVVTSGIGAGTTFDPPINALRQTIANMDGWSQLIEVEDVLPDDISAASPQLLGTTDLTRIRVSVRYQSPQDNTPQTIAQLTWVVGD